MKRAVPISVLLFVLPSIRAPAGQEAINGNWQIVPPATTFPALLKRPANYLLSPAPIESDGDEAVAAEVGSLVIHAQDRGALLGWSIAAGDLNGDGVDELIVGARGQSWSNGQTPQAGRVLIFKGAEQGLDTKSYTVRDGPTRRASFGTALGIIPDLNRDGFPELLVTGPTARQTVPAAGHAWMFSASANEKLIGSEHFWDAFGKRPGAWFGWSGANAGDVNGDKRTDVLIGAPRFNRTLVAEGSAILFLGTEQGLSRVAAWSAFGNRTEAELGFGMAALGDINNDGFDDVLISAPKYPGVNYMAGRVYAYLGSKSGLSNEAYWILEGGETAAQFGQSLFVFKAPGAATKFVVGAPGRNDESCDGSVYIFSLDENGLPKGPERVIRSEKSGSLFGQSVSGGDLNGDGKIDLVVGAPAFSGNMPRQGRVYAFYGTTGGFADEPSWIAEGTKAGTQCGWALSAGGDCNADGFADLAVGSPFFSDTEQNQGRLDLLYGSDEGLPLFNPAHQVNSTALELAPKQKGNLTGGLPFFGGAVVLILVIGRVYLQRRDAIARLGVAKEREQLARNLHDDVGAEITRVLMLSRMAAQPRSGVAPQKVTEAAEALNRTVEKIIWVLHPENDQLEKFAEYVGADMERLCESSNVAFRTDIPIELPDIHLPRSTRENLHLGLKECVINALKHSGASQIELRLIVKATVLTWMVSDNGIGVQTEASAGQNGLANLQRRMAELNGKVEAQSDPKTGTAIRLTVPLTFP